MLDDLDMTLRRLASAPVPAGLAAIETAVLDHIARDSAAGASRGGLLVSGLVALAIGFAGGLLPSGTTAEAGPPSPLGAISPLAPSTLLSASE